MSVSGRDLLPAQFRVLVTHRPKYAITQARRERISGATVDCFVFAPHIGRTPRTETPRSD